MTSPLLPTPQHTGELRVVKSMRKAGRALPSDSRCPIKREIACMRALDGHRGIVRLLGAFEDETWAGYACGQSLARHVRQTAIAPLRGSWHAAYRVSL